MKTNICKTCGISKVDKDNKFRSFCSVQCKYKSLIGKPVREKGFILDQKHKYLLFKGRDRFFANGGQAWNKGMKGAYKQSKETGIKISVALQGITLEQYTGHRTSEVFRLRMSAEYKIWREAIFKRDNWTCVMCLAHGGEGKKITLNADHIYPFALYPKLRFNLLNGRTLCVECHRKTNTFGINAKFVKTNIA